MIPIGATDSNGCWPWAGTTDRDGYGRLDSHPAHRVVYQLIVGAIPAGMQLDHLCRNRACVNPSHLEPVTPAMNNIRSLSVTAANKRKTHCKYGHPLSGDNLTVYAGSRRCKACACRNSSEYRLRKQGSQDRRSF